MFSNSRQTLELLEAFRLMLSEFDSGLNGRSHHKCQKIPLFWNATYELPCRCAFERVLQAKSY